VNIHRAGALYAAAGVLVAAAGLGWWKDHAAVALGLGVAALCLFIYATVEFFRGREPPTGGAGGAGGSATVGGSGMAIGGRGGGGGDVKHE